ncbi:MAG: hypothetical protein ABIZ81_13910, partial [Opitutaceae bacterium]
DSLPSAPVTTQATLFTIMGESDLTAVGRSIEQAIRLLEREQHQGELTAAEAGALSMLQAAHHLVGDELKQWHFSADPQIFTRLTPHRVKVNSKDGPRQTEISRSP